MDARKMWTCSICHLSYETEAEAISCHGDSQHSYWECACGRRWSDKWDAENCCEKGDDE